MIFEDSDLNGAFLIKAEKIWDNRGFFARTFCQRELCERGVPFECKQCNLSYNKKFGTLRGMHFQNPPYLEDKIVTCIRGCIYDVIVDLREDSKTYLKWQSYTLSEDKLEFLYVPKGFAHGFLTLEDNSDVFYMMSEFYIKGQESGIRYDDPVIGIEWPNVKEIIMSDKDKQFGYIKRS